VVATLRRKARSRDLGFVCSADTAKVGTWGLEFCMRFGSRILRAFEVDLRVGVRFLDLGGFGVGLGRHCSGDSEHLPDLGLPLAPGGGIKGKELLIFLTCRLQVGAVCDRGTAEPGLMPTSGDNGMAEIA
jgi:hypothetical protein